MKKYITLLCLCTLHVFANAQRTPDELLKTFQQYITGDFNNANQVTEEMATGKIIHPLAIHINRVADDKVINRPKGLRGFFLLEESYYLYEGKAIDVKPYLFLFQLTNDSTIHLTTYQLTEFAKETLRNNNPSLTFNYDSLTPSPTFKGANYRWNKKEKSFSTESVNELGNGMRFTLTEKFTATTLQVMELLEKNGNRITQYTTPILYERK